MIGGKTKNYNRRVLNWKIALIEGETNKNKGQIEKTKTI
jgi:hypothetical protein